MIAVTVISLLILSAVSGQECDWATFFQASNSLCTVSGVEVNCPMLKPSDQSVVVKCRETLKLTGYKEYHCRGGTIYPRSYTSRCVVADRAPCRPPVGKPARNMLFLQNYLHSFDELIDGVGYHVKCKVGFMFKDGVDPEKVTGQCEYVNKRATIQSLEECLPACEVKDNNRLNQDVENLDRITIVYPSNVRKVGDGKVVHAKAQCDAGYSPINQTVELVCSTKGVTSANSGYYLQTCKNEASCLKCAQNCLVPEIPDGTVYSRSGERQPSNSATIKTGDMTSYVECASGLNLIGTRHITCQGGVVTSELPTCSGAPVCSPPVIPNGYVNPDTSSKSSTEYTVTCNSGYTLGDPEKDSKVTCDLNSSEAKYSDHPPCHMGCGVPRINNGQVLDPPQRLSRDRAPYQTGATVEAVCDDAYIKQGEGSAARCDVSGWVNLPKCLSEEELSEQGKVSGKKSSATSTVVAPTLMILLSFITFLRF